MFSVTRHNNYEVITGVIGIYCGAFIPFLQEGKNTGIWQNT